MNPAALRYLSETLMAEIATRSDKHSERLTRLEPPGQTRPRVRVR